MFLVLDDANSEIVEKTRLIFYVLHAPKKGKPMFSHTHTKKEETVDVKNKQASKSKKQTNKQASEQTNKIVCRRAVLRRKKGGGSVCFGIQVVFCFFFFFFFFFVLLCWGAFLSGKLRLRP